MANQTENSAFYLRATFVGDSSTGKTRLIYTLSCGHFPEGPIPTVMGEPTATLEHEGKLYHVTLVDTRAEGEYEKLRPLCYQCTDVIVICYSVDNRESLHNAKNKWITEIRKFSVKKPVMLIATKLDLRFRPAAAETVSTEEGLEMQRKISAVSFVESSAREKLNLDRVLGETVRTYVSLKTKNQKKCNIL